MVGETIRFIHTADLHLGKAFPYREERFIPRGYKDRFVAFDKIVDLCKDLKVDYLFLVGDIFEQDLFKRSYGLYFFEKIAQLKNTQVLYLLGNHDYKLEAYLHKGAPENLYIFSSQAMDRWQDKDRSLEVFGQSWGIKAHFAKPKLPLQTQVGKRTILLHHGMWMGTEYFALNPSPEAINQFDYIGLGHIHMPEKINQKTYMVGTPEILNHKDMGDRGVVLGELVENVRTKFLSLEGRKIHKELVEISPQEGLDEILTRIQEKIQEPNDLYRIHLRGQAIGKDTLEALKYSIKNQETYILLEDESKSLINMQEIYNKHANDLLGAFLREIDALEIEDSMKERVAELGIEALLYGGER